VLKGSSHVLLEATVMVLLQSAGSCCESAGVLLMSVQCTGRNALQQLAEITCS